MKSKCGDLVNLSIWKEKASNARTGNDKTVLIFSFDYDYSHKLLEEFTTHCPCPYSNEYYCIPAPKRMRIV